MIVGSIPFRLLVFTCLWLVLTEFLCCSEEEQKLPRAERFYSCLHNCATCVQFWEYGLYNGRRCAKRCVRQQGREVVDPDCNDPKMFNYNQEIIKMLLRIQRNATAAADHSPEPAVEDPDVDADVLADEATRSPRTRPSRHHHQNSVR